MISKDEIRLSTIEDQDWLFSGVVERLNDIRARSPDLSWMVDHCKEQLRAINGRKRILYEVLTLRDAPMFNVLCSELDKVENEIIQNVEDIVMICIIAGAISPGNVMWQELDSEEIDKEFESNQTKLNKVDELLKQCTFLAKQHNDAQTNISLDAWTQVVNENIIKEGMKMKDDFKLVLDGSDKDADIESHDGLGDPGLLAVMTPEEQQQVAEFAKKIDVHDVSIVSNYGSDAQSRAASFSESALSGVSGRDIETVGELLAEMSTQIKDFDPDAKGLFGFLQRGKKRVEQVRVKYESVATSLDRIRDQLIEHQLVLKKDVKVLDSLYEENLKHYKELMMYIAAGKQAIQACRDGELRELSEKAAASGSEEDALLVRDLNDKLTQFEKQIYDLELTQTICLQMAPQIRIVQSTDTEIARTINSSINNALPLWKNQMVLALGLQHSRDAINAQRAVADVTNKMLLSQSEKLKVNAIDTAKASERGLVDVETLRQTNENLLTTIDEVLEIQKKGRENRQKAEEELQQIEDKLREHIVANIK